MNSDSLYGGNGGVCVGGGGTCVCACMHACVMCLKYTIIIFDKTDNDNNYIQIRHTDDFPSTGTRLV